MNPMKPMKPLKKPLIYSRHPSGLRRALPTLMNHLKAKGLTVSIEAQSATYLDNPLDDMYITEIQNLTQFDVIIVIGGDGSLLSVANLAAQTRIPILGLNHGKLGFLVDIDASAHDLIIDILSGQYITEQRPLLQTTLHDENGSSSTIGFALNECMVTRGSLVRMLYFDLYINGDLIYAQNADGMLIATPTGSTAYALSAGGPIMHPQVDATIIMPLYPHKLNTRPIIIDSHATVDLVPKIHNDVLPTAYCDGAHPTTIHPRQFIRIQKAPHQLMLIHPKNYQYYDILKAKLQWEHHA